MELLEPTALIKAVSPLNEGRDGRLDLCDSVTFLITSPERDNRINLCTLFVT